MTGVPPCLKELQEHALAQWVPTWLQAFCDPVNGGFHERLDPQMRPLAMHKRLLTQCRQIYVYSQAFLLTKDSAYITPLRAGFAFLRRSYHRPRLGGWAFSVTPEGGAFDPTFDLYGHAFVVLALSFYTAATGDVTAQCLLGKTLRFIDTHFRADAGFFERLRDDGTPIVGVRRQNSHMHLFEACVMAHTVAGEAMAKRMADELLGLFFLHFFDAPTGTLVEYFSPNWTPHPVWGHAVEPGHLYEWIWLLHRYSATQPRSCHASAITGATVAMAAWGRAHAWDSHQGGIYDRVQRADGLVLQGSKRIWHVAEALKASVILGAPHTPPPADLTAWLRTYVTPSGLWVETKQKDLTPATTHMPGTTPYHLVMGICEATRMAAAARPLPHLASVGG